MSLNLIGPIPNRGAHAGSDHCRADIRIGIPDASHITFNKDF
jgi:hypothetical protein